MYWPFLSHFVNSSSWSPLSGARPQNHADSNQPTGVWDTWANSNDHSTHNARTIGPEHTDALLPVTNWLIDWLVLGLHWYASAAAAAAVGYMDCVESSYFIVTRTQESVNANLRKRVNRPETNGGGKPNGTNERCPFWDQVWDQSIWCRSF